MYNPVESLFAPCGGNDADLLVNLRGMAEDEALKRLEAAMRRAADEQVECMMVVMDPPQKAGDHTLFQPVGQALKAHQTISIVSQVRPVAQNDCRGFYVEFDQRPAA